jgi:IclR family acetate operon transcriptional repressor
MPDGAADDERRVVIGGAFASQDACHEILHARSCNDHYLVLCAVVVTQRKQSFSFLRHERIVAAAKEHTMDRPALQGTPPRGESALKAVPIEDTASTLTDTASSLARGLSLLELFSVEDSQLSVSEMARRSGIPKSTTHRLVGDLLAWGALERAPGGVRLGVRMFELGHLVPTQRSLRELAVPFAHNLNEVTGLTSNLAVRDGQDVIYVEKVSSRNLRVPHSRAGGRLPLHCTALGKAILAYSDPGFIESVLAGELKPRSAKSITDPRLLRRELAHVRETKVAYDVEESQIGLFCVAAPVFTRRNAVIGAISVTGATELAHAQRFAPAVRMTALALSRALEGVQPLQLRPA